VRCHRKENSPDPMPQPPRHFASLSNKPSTQASPYPALSPLIKDDTPESSERHRQRDRRILRDGITICGAYEAWGIERDVGTHGSIADLEARESERCAWKAAAEVVGDDVDYLGGEIVHHFVRCRSLTLVEHLSDNSVGQLH
jgi:hypothetical protein